MNRFKVGDKVRLTAIEGFTENIGGNLFIGAVGTVATTPNDDQSMYGVDLKETMLVYWFNEHELELFEASKNDTDLKTVVRELLVNGTPADDILKLHEAGLL